MILVIGGYSSGKREYVEENFGYGLGNMSEDVLSEKPVLYNLQNTQLFEGISDMILLKKVVICDEIGCGIVPMDKNEREHRENLGNLLIKLAKEAEMVIRVHSGIGIRIK